MTCEVCKEEYQGTFQPPALAPPPPSSAPPPRQISPPLSHVRHVHPRSVFISIEPEIDVGSPIRRHPFRPIMSRVIPPGAWLQCSSSWPYCSSEACSKPHQRGPCHPLGVGGESTAAASRCPGTSPPAIFRRLASRMWQLHPGSSWQGARRRLISSWWVCWLELRFCCWWPPLHCMSLLREATHQAVGASRCVRVALWRFMAEGATIWATPRLAVRRKVRRALRCACPPDLIIFKSGNRGVLRKVSN